MNLLRIAILAAALAITHASAQTTKVTEQQARSYILSAFMTGAAPAVLSDDVKVPPTLRERLALAPESDSRAVYFALVRLTAGKSLTVRPAKIDELEFTETQVEAGKPVFALDVSASTFVLKYDLDRDSVTNVADASRPIAVTSPITAPEPPQPIGAPATAAAAQTAPPAEEPVKPAAETASPVTEVAKPTEEPAKPPVEEPAKPAPEPVKAAAEPAQPAAAAPAAAAPAPAAPAAAAPEPLPGARVQVIEPREPRFNKPAPPPAPAASKAAPPVMQVTREEPRLPPLKPNGACVIKPVMSDQDLVNCGASVR